MKSVDEMAAAALGRDPAIELIEYRKKWLTVGEMSRIADAINTIIDASGADPRAPVALVPRNRPEVLAAIVGLAARKRHVQMIHVYQSSAGIARDILRLKPAVLVAMKSDFDNTVRDVLREQGIAGVALSDIEVSPVETCDISTIQCEPFADEPQFDLLTSGTTGKPRQFPITYTFIANEIVTNSTLAIDEGPDPLTLPPAFLYWPFGNFSGLYATLTPLLQGMRGILADRFNLDECHDFLLRFRPTWLGLPPAGVQMVLDANIPVEDFESVQYVRVGSAPLSVVSHREFEDRYGIPVIQAYGATEFGGPVTAMPIDSYPEWGRKKLGSVGLPYRGAKLRVIDPETKEVLPAGAVGLLEVIAPRMGNDWIRTTDIGMIDEDGFVWHKGRADGAIMRGGFKILPEVIEEALVEHPSVAAAMATGIPDRRLGQVPAVGILLKPGKTDPGIDELESHLRERIESTHIPVAWRFLPSLPYNAMMKPDRIALSKQFEGQI